MLKVKKGELALSVIEHGRSNHNSRERVANYKKFLEIRGGEKRLETEIDIIAVFFDHAERNHYDVATLTALNQRIPFNSPGNELFEKIARKRITSESVDQIVDRNPGFIKRYIEQDSGRAKIHFKVIGKSIEEVSQRVDRFLMYEKDSQAENQKPLPTGRGRGTPSRKRGKGENSPAVDRVPMYENDSQAENQKPLLTGRGRGTPSRSSGKGENSPANVRGKGAAGRGALREISNYSSHSNQPSTPYADRLAQSRQGNTPGSDGNSIGRPLFDTDEFPPLQPSSRLSSSKDQNSPDPVPSR